MKNLFIYLFIYLFIISCKKNTTYYHGVVVDENYKPISNVIIKEIFKNSQSEISDRNGYFKLHKTPNVISDLVFSKRGYIKDTVSTVWFQYGEVEETRFINKTLDTIVLKKLIENKKMY